MKRRARDEKVPGGKTMSKLKLPAEARKLERSFITVLFSNSRRICGGRNIACLERKLVLRSADFFFHQGS